MAQSDQISQEYLLIKCFLYKYTPAFGSLGRTGSDLSTFSRFSVPLDDTQYFTKYDISSFITSYSFEQNIDETTYSWALELMDQAFSFSTIDTKLKVAPLAGSTLRKGLSFSQDTNSFPLLAEYETNANNYAHNTVHGGTSNKFNTVDPILAAKQHRGLTPGPMTVQGTNPPTISTIPGLRLSDLIQEYDFISVFLYKNTTPLTNIWGVFTTDDSLDNNPQRIFSYKVTSDIAQFGLKNPLDPELQNESVLLTKMPNGQTLFSNEFNGFVMKKNIISSTGQVDRLNITGNGWSRLFGSTRRAMKPSLFQNSLYEAGQVLGLEDVSSFENNLAGRNISEIVRDLFDQVYRIDFFTSTITVINTEANSLVLNKNNSTNLSTSTQNQSEFFASPLGGSLSVSSSFASASSLSTTNPVLLGDSFYNITSLIVANDYPANLFNIPQYLLSTVMKLRPFAYIEPINVPATVNFIDDAIAFAASQTANQFSVGVATAREVKVPPETFQTAMQNFDNSQQVINYGSKKPVLFEAGIQNLVAYFQFLADVFSSSFSPELMTPYEILDHIRSTSFIEIFEQPNGQFLLREPQYNNMAISITGRPDIALIRSSNLNIISSSYNETVENLVSKLFANYSPNIVPISTLQKFGYCDGKLLVQNGLMEMETAANPNAATASLSNNNSNDGKVTGIFAWAEYLMELANAKLKTGALICDLDNTVQVGQTFLDENKFKFGYIVGLSKKVSVTGTATMSLNLSYVRDAVPTLAVDGSIVNINMDLLPVLANIEKAFRVGS